MRNLLGILAVAVVALGFAGQAGAANGDQLRQIIANRAGTACVGDAAGNHGSVGVGVAFDGFNLLLSCYSDTTVTAVSPADGAQVAVHHIIGASSLGALAWDRSRNLLWACSGFDNIGTIDLSTNVFTYLFRSSNGCFDGLAFDGTDDTLWASGDVESAVYHYTSAGAVLSGNSVIGKIQGNVNSGIAVGGSSLYLANDGQSQIWEFAKDFSSSSLFASFPRRIEDMECDDVTFGAGKAAIWSIDAYDNILNAWELPAGSCQFGGGGDKPFIRTPGNIVVRATSSAGTPVSFTATAFDYPDGSVPVTCTPPSGSLFPLGVTTVTCTATDSNGNITSRSFTVTSRNAVVDSGPSGSTQVQEATVAFSASIPRSEVRCSLDGAPERKCSSTPLTYRGLAPGPHTFCVKGYAPRGVVDLTPDCISWSFDPPAPIVTITGSNLVGQSDLQITFTSDQPGPSSGSGFFCSLDGGPQTTCSSGIVYHGLAGTAASPQYHCIKVQAVSRFGLSSYFYDYNAGAWAHTPSSGAGIGCYGGGGGES